MPAEPVLMRCLVCSAKKNARIDFEGDINVQRCPACGATGHPFISPIVRVHLIYEDPAGPIIGYAGVRFRCACDPAKIMTAAMAHKEAMSGEAAAVNCSKCKQTEPWKDLDAQWRAELAAQQGFFTPLMPTG